MAYLEYGCSALPDHELVACGNYNRGGISAIGILEEDAFGTGATFATAADFSNGAKYTTAINATDHEKNAITLKVKSPSQRAMSATTSNGKTRHKLSSRTMTMICSSCSWAGFRNQIGDTKLAQELHENCKGCDRQHKIGIGWVKKKDRTLS